MTGKGDKDMAYAGDEPRGERVKKVGETGGKKAGEADRVTAGDTGLKLSKAEQEMMTVDVIVDSGKIGPNGGVDANGKPLKVRPVGWDELNARHGGGRVDWEIVARFLPTEFARLYEALVHRGLAVPGSMRGGRGYDESVIHGVGRNGGWALVSETPQKIGLSSSGEKASGNKTTVLSEAAVAQRQKVDREVRKLARKIKGWFEDESGKNVIWRCTGQKCGRFAEEDWRYCPWCGGDVDMVQRDSAKRTRSK